MLAGAHQEVAVPKVAQVCQQDVPVLLRRVREKENLSLIDVKVCSLDNDHDDCHNYASVQEYN